MRTRDWTATDGRDAGKTFRITEMPADQAERWAMRALLAFANAGARLPDGVLDAGMAGVVASLPMLLVQGVRSLAGMKYEDVGSLLDEMMTCVAFVPPGVPQTFPLMAGRASQVEEIRTRLQLRYEVLQVHMDPTLAAALQNWTASPPAASA